MVNAGAAERASATSSGSWRCCSMRKVLNRSLAFAILSVAATVGATAQQSAPAAAPPVSTAPVTMGDWVTSISLQGTPRYKTGFAHFDYVNPNAPKAGAVKLNSNDQ